MSDEPTGTGAASKARDLASIQAEIDRLEGESDQLRAKLQDFPQYEDAEGRHDARRYKVDELRLGEIETKIRRLRDQREEAKQQTDQWAQYGAKKGAEFLQARAPHLDEAIRKKASDIFREQVRSLVERQTFSRPELQSADAVNQLLQDRFNYAVGAAYAARANKADPADATPPREQGLDDESDPPKKEEDDGFGEDELARSMYKDYVPPRERKAKTLYDVQMEKIQAQRERDAKEGSGQ